MPNYNKVLLMGHLTRDPECKYLPSGTAVGDICIAVSHKYKDKDGNQKEETAFVDCTAFGKTAELMGKYLKKGNPLMVEGRLKQESWEDKQTGQKRSKLKVVVDSMQFLGGKEKKDEQPQTRPEGGYRKANVPAEPVNDELDDDSIPF